MLGLTLREEFRGNRLQGTAIELSNDANTGATQIAAANFLEITYPTHDLLKGIEAVGPNQGRPVVVIGERGLGKSHLLATLFHTVHDPASTRKWLDAWSVTLSDPRIGAIPLRDGMLVIGESLHRQRYKFLWDLLFERHPNGPFIRGKWEGMGAAKTDIPSDALVLELLKSQPTMLLLDEFQTWYDGQTNEKQHPAKHWAFNFVQILSEIAKEHPDLLVLVVSVRDGDTDAYQQIHRVNPIQIDFKAGGSPERIQIDRRRMMLHRLFENRLQIDPGDIDALIAIHVTEYFRLLNVLSRTERVLGAVAGGEERARHAWLAYESHALPLMEGASALTSARIDLLPHQVVLTHRIATASPRRFLVADEVGLGKTIETALILRELASRGELDRALMVVPAGLVNNWHRELNEVFNLNFEVFGSEGDITDRKTNAFAKHDRLIASIDTLKRPERIKRLLDAPTWDLVVFDEAHHLTAARNGGKIRKTENYKLAEALKGHARDLLLLSATPHQGNHFQFWMLVQLLNPTLFGSPEEMLESRHRLNTVMFRRTKADACRPDGEPLFARRWVHTESFIMSDEERCFYEKLREYLEDGFNLAQRRGNQGRALGFLMAIFQKIAASSFAAVRRTLMRRMLMLTLHEGLLRDRDLDIDGRERLYDEARLLIHAEWGFPRDSIGRSEVDRVMADLKYRLARKLDEEILELASDPYGTEYAAAHVEDVASAAVDLSLPEERLRISDLIALFPQTCETKVQKLLDGLGSLWRQDPAERIVIFATYLGTVELLEREIERVYPGQGVVVLRGGDHGAKLAAERRFRQKDGPRVLVCTAAGREGINLQFARVLFNFDLPWNPMDMEQRIGRIHRYGQAHTAQVYNLVLSDTIEGRIFLLLDDKLTEIARTLGKVDDNGDIAEDLRSQILGQLSERLNYDKLYQQALSDPELKRTAVELEAALSNAREAREVVFDLFQDLDGFSLDDYKPLSDISTAMDRLTQFLLTSVIDRKQRLVKRADATFELQAIDGSRIVCFTSDRQSATSRDDFELLGLDHGLVQQELARWRDLPPEEIGIAVDSGTDSPMITSSWLVESSNGNGERRRFVQSIAVTADGTRVPSAERQIEQAFFSSPSSAVFSVVQRRALFEDAVEPTLQRELKYKGAANGDGSYSATLISYIEST